MLKKNTRKFHIFPYNIEQYSPYVFYKTTFVHFNNSHIIHTHKYPMPSVHAIRDSSTKAAAGNGTLVSQAQEAAKADRFTLHKDSSLSLQHITICESVHINN